MKMRDSEANGSGVDSFRDHKAQDEPVWVYDRACEVALSLSLYVSCKSGLGFEMDMPGSIVCACVRALASE